MKQRALVTGASGFVGSHLTRALRRGGWHVEVLVRPDSNRSRFTADRIHLCESEEFTELNRAVRLSKPDVVFHLASLFLAEHEPTEVGELIRSNITLGANLLEAMYGNNIRRLVNVGTSWQHFHSETYNPVCLYAATKQAFEAIVDFYVQARDFRVITLKLFDTYGPNDHRGKLMHLLERAVRDNQQVDFSPGEQILDLLHIDDAMEAFLVAAVRVLSDGSSSHEIFALSSGTTIQLRDLVALYASLSGRTLPIRLGARPYRTREVMHPWTAGKRLPGWTPRIPLRDGLAELIAQRDGALAGAHA